MNEFVGLAPNSADPRSQGVGEVLRRERAARRWSQELAAHHFAEVAKTLGISVPDVDALRIAFSRWENGHHRPGADSLIVLRHLYGGEVDHLGVLSGEVGQSGDWWLASEGGVGSVVIVEVKPGR